MTPSPTDDLALTALRYAAGELPAAEAAAFEARLAADQAAREALGEAIRLSAAALDRPAPAPDPLSARRSGTRLRPTVLSWLFPRRPYRGHPLAWAGLGGGGGGRIHDPGRVARRPARRRGCPARDRGLGPAGDARRGRAGGASVGRDAEPDRRLAGRGAAAAIGAGRPYRVGRPRDRVRADPAGPSPPTPRRSPTAPRRSAHPRARPSSSPTPDRGSSRDRGRPGRSCFPGKDTRVSREATGLRSQSGRDGRGPGVTPSAPGPGTRSPTSPHPAALGDQRLAVQRHRRANVPRQRVHHVARREPLRGRRLDDQVFLVVADASQSGTSSR